MVATLQTWANEPDSNGFLTGVPQLLNSSKIYKLHKKYYPRKKWKWWKEGYVVADLHINTKGKVISVDIVQSGGDDFDKAVRKIAKKMRFSSGRIGHKLVEVRLRRGFEFKRFE